MRTTRKKRTLEEEGEKEEGEARGSQEEKKWSTEKERWESKYRCLQLVVWMMKRDIVESRVDMSDGRTEKKKG
ncbi:hypothetical protein TRV_05236 [Trichophyton verrucosum HKI 0517]|uniref:Uncharacterized protein n=1 Tax=Trichophyton verrucosum (strain HKI 0517) TaxID=663202 RepID=D4DDM5_TRIVH|nr:uncharacterized protein TRV_05236 [Trichophyton verrucosum HKI 0517]EFE40092.1 hypothetical protein TRV_05236 [Trichophyton verrucosum HKI 0517]